MIGKKIVWDYQRVGEHYELEQFGLGKVVDHQLGVRMS
jgi:hypothetical protein